ncbi:maleylacetoacetate isomerase [Legionella sp. km772]|uniref:maleylacetoacetate isomerase n=1 Tax=Legionella sp. km772 TaxID=2498111 RepID=UPI000F8F0A31|nr:maleylacetoacetate isomerase [Legionella sp. km772]RUR12051.1 maleylacetoacetate isomerase [Legionella sp. km772]
MKLYDYYRSTACYRVRIALNIKNIHYDKIPVHLVNNGGEQHSSEYHHINPQELVPSLEANEQIIHQSLAIIEYLEEIFPEIPLLPHTILDKAQVRSLALLVACDMHPLNNLRVLNRLKQQFSAQEADVQEWYHYWLRTGFDAFEEKLHHLKRSKAVCFGDTPTIADVCLIPQVYNAKRFNFSMDDYPLISQINSYCLTLPPFQNAAPD